LLIFASINRLEIIHSFYTSIKKVGLKAYKMKAFDPTGDFL